VVQVVWTEPALADLQEIHDYIAEDSPRNAEAMVLQLQAAVLRLADFPLSGRAVPELVPSEYREVISGSYRIIYRYIPDQDTVLINAVYHGRRRLRDPGNRS
jgi:toxin ParE1/3/4